MHIEMIRTPVLIVGAGAAGLRAAIALHDHAVDCLVLGKRDHGDAHTVCAAGGINAALGNLDPQDHWALHAADTMAEGHDLCDPVAVELLARQAPARIRELHDWGCDFAKTDNNKINQRYFGAQTCRRTCFVGDETGKAILHTLVDQAKTRGIKYRDRICITKLLKHNHRVVGAAGYDMKTGEGLLFAANAVVLATGGYASVYSRNTSREDENTGDGMALALEAGASLRDMEMVQFHPTGKIRPKVRSGELVTEAMRGEGGRLYNKDGQRFMERYSPERLELDARDVVARAIWSEIKEGRGTQANAVKLDVSHIDAESIRERLPKMLRQFEEEGVDITREPVEVAPTAHYAMGGIRVDFTTGQTDVPGLYAVGETTGGLHGANRLGGNSLAETVVFGKLVGEHLAKAVKETNEPRVDQQDARRHLDALQAVAARENGEDPQPLLAELRDLMWTHAGVVRTQPDLENGLQHLAELRRKSMHVAGGGSLNARPFESAISLQCMLPVAEAILRCALHRTETRGGHCRKDHEQTDDNRWRVNIICRRSPNAELALTEHPAPPMPEAIREAMDQRDEASYHHLE